MWMTFNKRNNNMETYEVKVLAIVQDWLDAEDGIALCRAMDKGIRAQGEAAILDACLADIRSGALPIVRLTDAQLAEIENERWGE
jgi:hypothetical protein